jgi:hypothetical protein
MQSRRIWNENIYGGREVGKQIVNTKEKKKGKIELKDEEEVEDERKESQEIERHSIKRLF